MKKTTLLPLLLLVSCGPDWDPDFYCKMYEPETSSAEAYVINGEEITEETNLSTLALFHPGAERPYCSAVAYKPQIVLTAAHCVGSPDMEVSRSLYGPRIAVDDIYVHRFWDGGPSADYDLAMLHLAEPITGPFPAGIYDPAAGGYEPDFRYFCTGMAAQGFGNTRGTNPRGLHTIPYEVGYASSLWNLETGPVNPDQGLCNGDSGGGLYAFVEDHPWQSAPAFLVAGIAIQGYNENCLGRTRHTYLESYSMWVFEVIHCMNGGEDRQWPFFILGNGGYRGTTCEELRKEL